ncbi:MAG: glycosyltransferase family 4 protein [Salinivenus sp.]
MRVLSCQSAYGRGGVGQHFAHLVEETKATVGLAYYLNSRPNPDDGPAGRKVSDAVYQRLYQWTPLRYSTGWSSYLKNDLFDRRAASTLDEPAERFMGFVGQALHSFERADALGFKELELVAVNSHVDNVRRLHDQAARQWSHDDSWLNDWHRRKTLAEYERADRIFVHSEYTRQSFLDAGVPESKLERTDLTPAPRFVPPSSRPDDDIFRVVYVGRVDITKGIPVLLEAFSRLPDPAELTIVGGWATRHMKAYMQSWLDREPRLRMAPGDPLPALHAADVFVHPSYEDGFGYAPAEAMACGVPVIVTEDTGMKEYVTEGENGYIVPTGSVDALHERLSHLRRHPIRPVSPTFA